MRTTDLEISDEDKFAKVHVDRRLKLQCVHRIWQKQRKPVMFFCNIYFRFIRYVSNFLRHWIVRLIGCRIILCNSPIFFRTKAFSPVSFSRIILPFQSLVKIFPDKQNLYTCTNNVKVIKIHVDYTRFENSCCSILTNIQGSSIEREINSQNQ